MVFGFFGKRGRARQLVKLAEKTIVMMENMLRAMRDDDPDRSLIAEHLRRRQEALYEYSRLARGETGEFDQLRGTMRNYEIWKRSMENEVARFSASPQQFAWYLKAIKQ